MEICAFGIYINNARLPAIFPRSSATISRKIGRVFTRVRTRSSITWVLICSICYSIASALIFSSDRFPTRGKSRALWSQRRPGWQGGELLIRPRTSVKRIALIEVERALITERWQSIVRIAFPSHVIKALLLIHAVYLHLTVLLLHHLLLVPALGLLLVHLVP